MSDASQTLGSWQASDGNWYPAEQHPNNQPAPAPVAGQTAPQWPDWWKASDGLWHPPEVRVDSGPTAPQTALNPRLDVSELVTRARAMVSGFYVGAFILFIFGFGAVRSGSGPDVVLGLGVLGRQIGVSRLIGG